MSLEAVIRDAFCRVIAARDLMEEGNNRAAEAVLYELEIDLQIAVDRIVMIAVDQCEDWRAA